MNNFLKKTLSLIIGDDTPETTKLTMPKKRSFKQLTERELLNRESEIGQQLFGPIPAGHRREFFCLDETTWIWYEEWKDEKGNTQQATTRYEVHDNGILKVQEGARYKFIDGEELANLVTATRFYYERVAREVYGRDPGTGAKLA